MCVFGTECNKNGGRGGGGVCPKFGTSQYKDTFVSLRHLIREGKQRRGVRKSACASPRPCTRTTHLHELLRLRLHLRRRPVPRPLDGQGNIGGGGRPRGALHQRRRAGKRCRSRAKCPSRVRFLSARTTLHQLRRCVISWPVGGAGTRHRTLAELVTHLDGGRRWSYPRHRVCASPYREGVRDGVCVCAVYFAVFLPSLMALSIFSRPRALPVPRRFRPTEAS